MSDERRDYIWFDPAGREPEQARLQRQAALYDPITLRVLDAAGIGRGMRVLDLGSGAGDVTILLSEIVGSEGAVVGVERDPDAVSSARERVRSLGIGNVEFVEGDVADLGLDGVFDAVVGRLILMYVADPAAVLRRVAGRVRPDGLVCMLEISLRTPRHARDAAVRAGRSDHRSGVRSHRGGGRRGGCGPRHRLGIRIGGHARSGRRRSRPAGRHRGIVTLWPMLGAWSRI